MIVRFERSESVNFECRVCCDPLSYYEYRYKGGSTSKIILCDVCDKEIISSHQQSAAENSLTFALPPLIPRLGDQDV